MNPDDLHAALTGVTVHFTEDQRVLRGRRGRWFPRTREIVIDRSLRYVRQRCTEMHELAHAALDHGPCGGQGLYDYRRELQADEFAARLLVDDVDHLVEVLAHSLTRGHAAAELGVTVDILETRLSTLTPHEHRYLSTRVAEVHEGRGA